jgi:lysophospholipase L1-like esterase
VLAQRVERRWAKTPQMQNASCESFSRADRDAFLAQLEQKPDLVMVALGHDSVVGGIEPEQFRATCADIIGQLTEKTGALVILITPPPIARQDSMDMYEIASGLDSAPHAWQLETLAQAHKLPIVRTGAVLANSSYGLADLYSDNLHLSAQGHETLGIVLDRLLAGL